jgi:hypothetical protein
MFFLKKNQSLNVIKIMDLTNARINNLTFLTT